MVWRFYYFTTYIKRWDIYILGKGKEIIGDSDKVNIKVLPPSFHIPTKNKEDYQLNSKRIFQSKNVY
tara:strand:- start:2177 stop:2377 length:201 start_codon:yes stop_codon:yes gene_type:complete